jgi:LAO/AO transport system kinase
VVSPGGVGRHRPDTIPAVSAPEDLVHQALAGDRRALARVLSLVERGGPEARTVARLVHPAGGGAHTLGVTGAPGAGKSTLASALVAVMRSHDERVAVLAIDPTSPYSGGAILGDRVRMGVHALDDEVFIRSMATRGHLGGLTLAAPEAVRVLDAAGFGWVVVETVGVGQVEVEVAGAADTTVVVVNPGWGDAIQANKAGLMEIADVFVVNKADRPGAADTVRDLEQMLDLAGDGRWRPPVVSVTATTGEGTEELWAALEAHTAHLADSGELGERRARRQRDEVERIVVERLYARARELRGDRDPEALVARVLAREIDPWTAADELLGDLA